MFGRIVTAAAVVAALLSPAAVTPASALEGCAVHGSMETTAPFGLPVVGPGYGGNFELRAAGACIPVVHGLVLDGDIEGYCGNMIAPNYFVVVGATIVFTGPVIVGVGTIAPAPGESCLAGTADAFLVTAVVAKP